MRFWQSVDHRRAVTWQFRRLLKLSQAYYAEPLAGSLYASLVKAFRNGKSLHGLNAARKALRQAEEVERELVAAAIDFDDAAERQTAEGTTKGGSKADIGADIGADADTDETLRALRDAAWRRIAHRFDKLHIDGPDDAAAYASSHTAHDAAGVDSRPLSRRLRDERLWIKAAARRERQGAVDAARSAAALRDADSKTAAKLSAASDAHDGSDGTIMGEEKNKKEPPLRYRKARILSYDSQRQPFLRPAMGAHPRGSTLRAPPARGTGGDDGHDGDDISTSTTMSGGRLVTKRRRFRQSTYALSTAMQLRKRQKVLIKRLRLSRELDSLKAHAELEHQFLSRLPAAESLSAKAGLGAALKSGSKVDAPPAKAMTIEPAAMYTDTAEVASKTDSSSSDSLPTRKARGARSPPAARAPSPAVVRSVAEDVGMEDFIKELQIARHVLACRQRSWEAARRKRWRTLSGVRDREVRQVLAHNRAVRQALAERAARKNNVALADGDG